MHMCVFACVCVYSSKHTGTDVLNSQRLTGIAMDEKVKQGRKTFR